MADNLTLNAGSGGSSLLTYEGTFSGDTAHLQGITVFGVSGAEGSYTLTNISDPTNGLLVNLGANNDVTLATLPDTAAGDLAAINTAVSGTLTVGSHAVTNAGTFAVQADSVIPGTGATSLGKAEDAAHSTGDTGVLALAVRRAADTPTSGTDGDYEPLKTDANGHLKVEIFDGGDSHTIDGTVTANLSAVDNAVLDQIDANTDYGVVVGGGVEATALRVTIASDSTGVLSVDDNGGSLTIDGAHIAAEAAALGSGVLIQGDDGTDRKNINVDATTGDVQVDVTNTVTVSDDGSFTLGANSGVDIGDVDVTSISAGANLIGDVGLSGARTSGGTTPYKNIDVDETEDQIKGTAGQVYWIHAMNLSGSPLYLKFYNATAATVIVGTTVPDFTFPLATQGDTNGAGFTLSIPNGIAFGTAITVACTTGIADNDTGAPGANACVLNLGYA